MGFQRADYGVSVLLPLDVDPKRIEPESLVPGEYIARSHQAFHNLDRGFGLERRIGEHLAVLPLDSGCSGNQD